MRILLLGARGQLGSHLNRYLGTLGEVHCTVAPDQTAEGLGHPALAVDLADGGAVLKLVTRVAPQVIVNAAAYTAVDRAEDEPDLARTINSQLPQVLGQAAETLGAAVIHYSTDYVYPGIGESAMTEETPTGPLSAYGLSKLEGDLALQKVCSRAIILRTSWVYGPYGNNFVKTMLSLAQKRESLSVVGDQVGAPTATQTLVGGTCHILARCGINASANFKEKSGIYHLCDQGQTSWYDFAKKIFLLTSALPLVVKEVQRIPAAQYPTKAKRPGNSRLNCDKIKAAFGLRLPHWEVALEQSLPDIIAHR